MKTITGPNDLIAWREANLDPDRDHAPQGLRLIDIVLYRYLARRDGHRYNWPVVDGQGQVVAISWGHAVRRHGERLTRLMEGVEAEVAPVRSYITRLEGEIAVEDARLAVARDVLNQLTAPDLESRTAGESESAPSIVRHRRTKEHQAVVARLSRNVADAQERRHELAVTLASAQQLLVERWGLHVRNAMSWWAYLGRLGEVIARGAARHHSDPTAASTLMRRVIAEAKPEFPATHPWTPSHH
jgi:hypothetical protein